MIVICNVSKICKMRGECGGAKPHELCSECGKCPFNKEAKCEEIPHVQIKGSHHG